MNKAEKRAVVDRINAHLRRFEADPKINVGTPETSGNAPYYKPLCYPDTAGFVYVACLNYMQGRRLSFEFASEYLTWLDSGNVGTPADWWKTKGGAS